VIAAVCVVAATWKAAPALRRDATRAVALVGLNPVLLVYGVGGDHNDLIMVALLVGSILLLISQRATSSGWLAVTAVAVKLTGAVLLPFALVANAQRSRRRLLLGIASGSLLLVVLSVGLFGLAPLRLVGTLEHVQGGDPRQSIPGIIVYLLGLGAISSTLMTALQAMALITGAGLVWAVWAERLDWLTAAGWAVGLLLATCSLLQPWYVVWLLPFAALTPSPYLRWTCFAMTAIGITSL
jgi:uncharacterized membrane protein